MMMNKKFFLTDLPITTNKHHKWRHILHLKADSGAQKSIMNKKLYNALEDLALDLNLFPYHETCLGYFLSQPLDFVLY